jgi:CBS domain-containing protein
MEVSVLARARFRALPDVRLPAGTHAGCMLIESIMTRDVLTVTPETPLKEVALQLSRAHISGLPVCGADCNLLGVVSEADILRKEEGIAADVGGRLHWLFRRMDGEVDKISARTAGEAMTSPAITIRPKQRVSDAASLMIEHRVNRLPVVIGGSLVGIVTRTDLVRAFHRSDEEIEHEIRDEVLHHTLWAVPGSMQLSVVDGVVSLRGSVDSRMDAELAAKLVRQVPGVVDATVELQWRTDERERVSIDELYPR